MPIKIDERAVRTAKAPAKGAITIWDTEVKGFGLRVFAQTRRNPEGARAFFINYRTPGSNVGSRSATSRSGGSGRAQRGQGPSQADRPGEDPARERREKREAPTVKDLAERTAASICRARRHRLKRPIGR